jgi:hypothetical protein
MSYLILMVLPQPKTEWDDYFSGIIPKEYGTRQTPTDTIVYVSNCLFRSITSSSHGGALCCTSVTYLLIGSSSFFSCYTSTQYGGAVYFQNTNNGQCIMYEICCNDCLSTYTSASSFGQFAYITVGNSVSSKNYFNYSSTVHCLSDPATSCRTSSLINGKVYCPSINSSMNKCVCRPGIFCQTFCDTDSLICSLSYSSITDNNATGHTCIILWTPSTKHEVKRCNIIRNTQVSLGSEGTIRSMGNAIIYDSCLLENKANYIFYAESSSYTMTLSNCTVDLTSNNGFLTIQNTVIKSFILALNHVSTRNCHAGYDSVGTLTPIIEPSKRRMRCFTYEKCFYHPTPQIFLFFVSFYFSS